MRTASSLGGQDRPHVRATASSRDTSWPVEPMYQRCSGPRGRLCRPATSSRQSHTTGTSVSLVGGLLEEVLEAVARHVDVSEEAPGSPTSMPGAGG